MGNVRTLGVMGIAQLKATESGLPFVYQIELSRFIHSEFSRKVML